MRRILVIIAIILSLFSLPTLSHSKNKKQKSHSSKALPSQEWREEFVLKVLSKEQPEWMLKQIKADLRSFTFSDVTQKMLDETMQDSDLHFLARFRIRDSFLTMYCPISHERVQLMTKALQILCDTVYLPDVDFIVSLHDSADGIDFQAPVFAFAKHINSHRVISIPDFEALFGQTAFISQLDNGIRQFPWDKKISKAFWRGATTGGNFSEDNFLNFPRSKAVTLSLEMPSLIDARFNLLAQCNEPEKIKRKFAAYFGASASVKDHLRYKYQLLIDGNSCAYSRAYWQLFSNCVILKQSSPNIQWYYSLLKPYEHYIPLQENLDDLAEKILWAKEHDEEVLRIVDNAQKLAKENLKQSDVYYYLYLLLTEYAKLQR